MTPIPHERRSYEAERCDLRCRCLVDISTVRHHDAGPGRRNFEAFHSASADCPPIARTLVWVEEMHDAGHRILVVTARMEKWRNLTQAWLDRYLTRHHTELVMRRDGDYRPDIVVKREIHAELSARYCISAACDDNPNVLALWEELGIPVTVVPGWPG